ncbi:MAG: hypothetical protein M3Y91_15370 [Actinomycetota bacterium]|nr:hypothetical protein [Actinomycetota bacterium]
MSKPAGWRTTRWCFGVALLALVTVLTGCCRSDYGSQLPPAPHSSVTYNRTGGLAGFDDTLVIDDQGKATASRGRGSQRGATTVVPLLPGEFAKLKTLLSQAHLDGLDCSYTTSSPYPDDYRYLVRYEGHTVKVDGGATSTPRRLETLIGLLDAIQTRGVQGPSGPR